jgi:hypothetical protein
MPAVMSAIPAMPAAKNTFLAFDFVLMGPLYLFW